MVVWQPYLARDQLRIERVQNRFLAYAAYVLYISHPLYDYTSISSSLNIPTLSSHRFDADIYFMSSLLNGSIDAPDLFSTISFRIPVYPTSNHSLYYGDLTVLTITISILYIECSASLTPPKTKFHVYSK